MQLVDTHCHLQFDKLSADVNGVIKRANQAEVSKLICVGTTLADSRQAVKFASDNDNVWAAVGIHPHDIKDFKSGDDKNLAELLSSPKVVAVGEIGLDYFKAYSTIEDQRRCLRLLVKAGLPSGLPFIFHVREAFDDFWPVFDSHPGIKGVIHSFSAGRRELDEIIKRGLYVGLNGIMTFTNDQEQLAAAKTVPLDKLVLETDAPFLAPKAYRGQICEPKHVRDIAKFLAELRNESLQELASTTTKNAKRLFGI